MDRVARLAGLAALVLLASLAFAPAASAASFDCAKAGSPTEKAICRDPAVSRLDEQVAAAFKAALTLWPAGNWPAYIRTEQRNWLKDRNGICKGDVACLKRDYELRLGYLQRRSLKWTGRYVAGACPKDGIFFDVSPSYPKDELSIDIYHCPDSKGNMLLQVSGMPDAAGRLDYKDGGGCPVTLNFAQDTVAISGPKTGPCKLLFDARVFRRDPTRSPFRDEARR